MARTLILGFLALLLIQPATAETSSSLLDQIAIHFQPASEAIPGNRDIRRDVEAWEGGHAGLSHIPPGSFWINLTSLNKSRGNFSRCNDGLALGPDVPCIRACDASKESCDRRCSVGRAACLAQCPGLGFACDYYCHAAFYVCTAMCAKDHDACVGRCPARGGEKE